MNVSLESLEKYEFTTVHDKNERPALNTLNSILQELVSVTRAIPNIFNPQMGHACRVTNQAQCAARAPPGAPNYHIPPPPPPEPAIPHGATAAERDRLNKMHEKEVIENYTGTRIDQILVPKLVMFFGVVVDVMRHVLTGFDNVTVIMIMTHVFATYGAPTRQMLKKNEEDMAKAWDPNLTLIEGFWSHLQLGQQYAAHTSQPVTDGRLMNVALTAIENTGKESLTKAVTDWPGDRDLAAQTWANFKAHFTSAFDIYTKTVEYQNRHTAGSQGCHGANNAQGGTNGNAQSTTNETGTFITNVWHCHTCGLNWNHLGINCGRKGPNHGDDATCENKMNGNTRIWQGRDETRPPRRNGNGNNANNANE